MIPRSDTKVEPKSWQQQLQQGFSHPEELISYLNLPSETLNTISPEAIKQFAMRIPRAFADRMEKGNPADPLLRQVLPLKAEMLQHIDFIEDPLAESHANPQKGVLHKYKSRILLALTGACAINCRYCFRRHFPYEENNPGKKGWETVKDYVIAHPDVNEICLSGGDPLTVNDDYFFSVVKPLAELPQITRVRIHSRIPIVLPDRLTEKFINTLSSLPTNIILVVHCNHPNEIDASVKKIMSLCRDHKITLFNQSVLLRGINDDADVLIKLSETLFSAGILPYYLHLPDKVKNTTHFFVDEDEGKTIIKKLRQELPGFLVPQLVKEIPGEMSKTLIA